MFCVGYPIYHQLYLLLAMNLKNYKIINEYQIVYMHKNK